MDPRETLRRMREIVTATNEKEAGYRGELYDLFEDLDEWMSKGGFSPWDEKQRSYHEL